MKFVGDNSPSAQVTAGLAIPQFQAKGYFQHSADARRWQAVILQAPFIGYYDWRRNRRCGDPLPVTVTAKSGSASVGSSPIPRFADPRDVAPRGRRNGQTVGTAKRGRRLEVRLRREVLAAFEVVFICGGQHRVVQIHPLEWSSK